MKFTKLKQITKLYKKQFCYLLCLFSLLILCLSFIFSLKKEKINSSTWIPEHEGDIICTIHSVKFWSPHGENLYAQFYANATNCHTLVPYNFIYRKVNSTNMTLFKQEIFNTSIYQEFIKPSNCSIILSDNYCYSFDVFHQPTYIYEYSIGISSIIIFLSLLSFTSLFSFIYISIHLIHLYNLLRLEGNLNSLVNDDVL